GWTEGEGSAGIYLAQIYATLDAPEVMRRYLETAYRKAVEARDLRGQIYALNDLAGIEDSDGENAAGLLRRALELMGPEISAQDRVAGVSGLVSTLMHAGKLDEADQRMKEALAIARKDGGRATLSYALTVLSELRLA